MDLLSLLSLLNDTETKWIWHGSNKETYCPLYDYLLCTFCIKDRLLTQLCPTFCIVYGWHGDDHMMVNGQDDWLVTLSILWWKSSNVWWEGRLMVIAMATVQTMALFNNKMFIMQTMFLILYKTDPVFVPLTYTSIRNLNLKVLYMWLFCLKVPFKNR